MRQLRASWVGPRGRNNYPQEREREKRNINFEDFRSTRLSFKLSKFFFFLFHAGILQSILAWIFHILGFHCCNSCCLLKRARLLIFTNPFCSVASPLLLKRAVTSALYKKHLFVVNGNGNDGGNNRARDTREIFKLCPVRKAARRSIDRSFDRRGGKEKLEKRGRFVDADQSWWNTSCCCSRDRYQPTMLHATITRKSVVWNQPSFPTTIVNRNI